MSSSLYKEYLSSSLNILDEISALSHSFCFSDDADDIDDLISSVRLYLSYCLSEL